MKITFVLPFASLAGGTRVVADYASELTARGHQVTVVSQPDRPIRLGFWARLRGRKARPSQVPTPLLDFLGPRHVILDRRRPVTNADLPDADVVIATWWETAEWVAALSLAKGRKFQLLQDYEMFPHLPTDQVAASFHLPLRKMAVSAYIRDKVLENHGVRDIAVLPNAVDSNRFNAPPRFKNAALRVGFLYAPEPRKNLGLALATVRAAQACLPDLRVASFGTSLPLSHHPLPLGVEYSRNPPQADIAAIYASCDLWLFTSHNEGFGLPILEAMACRTPVLATWAGAAPDLINGTNGLLLDPDPQAFAAAIARFHAMGNAEWQGFSTAAWQTARAHRIGPATDRLMSCLAAA